MSNSITRDRALGLFFSDQEFKQCHMVLTFTPQNSHLSDTLFGSSVSEQVLCGESPDYTSYMNRLTKNFMGVWSDIEREYLTHLHDREVQIDVKMKFRIASPDSRGPKEVSVQVKFWMSNSYLFDPYWHFRRPEVIFSVGRRRTDSIRYETSANTGDPLHISWDVNHAMPPDKMASILSKIRRPWKGSCELILRQTGTLSRMIQRQRTYITGDVQVSFKKIKNDVSKSIEAEEKQFSSPMKYDAPPSDLSVRRRINSKASYLRRSIDGTSAEPASKKHKTY